MGTDFHKAIIILLYLFYSGSTRTYLKNKISVQGKARNGEKAESRQDRRDEQYILNRFATPPWALRLFLR